MNTPELASASTFTLLVWMTPYAEQAHSDHGIQLGEGEPAGEILIGQAVVKLDDL